MIDIIERSFMSEMGIVLVIHMDPILVNCERTNFLKQEVLRVIQNMDAAYTIHDFRVTDGENRINLIFDLVVPIEMKPEDKRKVLLELESRVKEMDLRYNTVIQLDDGY